MGEPEHHDEAADPEKTRRERDHDQRNRMQQQLLQVAFERKRHADYIEELRRRLSLGPQESSARAGGDEPEGE